VASVDNCRLFVGGIPKTVVRDQILTEMKKITEGVQNVIVYPSANDKSKNRGFAFVEYDSHRSAAMARRKLLRQPFTLWGHTIAVDWAEPELEVDEDIMQQVKVLYVRNLHIDTQESTIAETFSRIAPVERVKKIRDYAFVHFSSKEDARQAKKVLDGTKIDGCDVEVSLAKPVDRESHARHLRNKMMLNPPAGTQYAAGFDLSGLGGGAVPSLPYAAQFMPQLYQPFMFPGMGGLGGMAGLGELGVGGLGGTSAASMVNPLTAAAATAATAAQQIRGRGRPLRGAAGSRGARGSFNGMGAHGRAPIYGLPAFWYDPKRRRGLDGPERMFDLLPGMELTPATHFNLKPPENKSPIQVRQQVS